MPVARIYNHPTLNISTNSNIPCVAATFRTKGSKNKQLIQRDHQEIVRLPPVRRATKFQVACRVAEIKTNRNNEVDIKTPSGTSTILARSSSGHT